jgi:hypothetical protein
MADADADLALPDSTSMRVDARRTGQWLPATLMLQSLVQVSGEGTTAAETAGPPTLPLPVTIGFACLVKRAGGHDLAKPDGVLA